MLVSRIGRLNREHNLQLEKFTRLPTDIKITFNWIFCSYQFLQAVTVVTTVMHPQLLLALLIDTFSRCFSSSSVIWKKKNTKILHDKSAKTLYPIRLIPSLLKLNFLPTFGHRLQWRIQGRGPGGPAPIFLNQTDARRAEKNFFGDRATPLSKGVDDRRPSPPPNPLSRGLDPAVDFQYA